MSTDVSMRTGNRDELTLRIAALAGAMLMLGMLVGCGSKNAIKGLGFFIGALLLSVAGFQGGLWLMAGFLAVILAGAALGVAKGMGKAKKKAKFTEILSKSREINLLSAARVFLFGARDVWFVVGIPIYFYAVLSDGSAVGNRAAFFMIDAVPDPFPP